MSSYLVTGCAGFLGSHLTEALLAQGHDIVGVDSFTDYYSRARKESNLSAAAENPSFRHLEIDLAEEPLDPEIEDVDGIFHLAAQPGVHASWGQSFDLYTRNNLLATQRVFEAAAAAGRRVVLASSSSVYGEAEGYPTSEDAPPCPISPYGVTKLGCEHLARAYAGSHGLDVVALRYFTVYGPRQRPDMAFARIFAALVEDGQFIVYGSGDQSRDFTYVADAVSATVIAFEAGRSGEVYNVGGGTEASLRDVIRLVEALTETALDTDFDEEAAGDIRRTRADTRRIRAELGWSPKTSLEEGLEDQLRFVLQAPDQRIPVGLTGGRRDG